jgi:hypothetical protein
MSDDVADEARAQLELAHRIHREILDVILRVADETGRDPGELAQLVAMGGGVHNMLQPLTMRWHEKRQQEFMAQQQAAAQRQPAKPSD